MRLARLPLLDNYGAPPVGECVVAKPETWLEDLALRLVPGRWYDHVVFGRLRVLDMSPARAPQEKR